jgi:hypothetical protein
LKSQGGTDADATDAKIPTQSMRDGATSAQSRQDIALALMREADRRGAGLHIGEDSDLKRHDVHIDPAFLIKLKEYKPDIIAILQNGGGWNDRS